MLRTDRKMLKQILRASKDMNDIFSISDKCDRILLMKDLHNVKNSFRIRRIKPRFVLSSVRRLIDSGYLCYHTKYMGGFTFSITDLALLRREIFFERFTRKFWYGYLSGVVTGVTVSVLGHFILKLLSALEL